MKPDEAESEDMVKTGKSHPKDQIVMIYVDNATKQSLKERASFLQTTVSNWIRQAILERMGREDKVR